VLSSVGSVRMGWRIEDVIVIWERVVGEDGGGGKETACIGRMRMALVELVRLYPVKT